MPEDAAESDVGVEVEVMLDKVAVAAEEAVELLKSVMLAVVFI